MYISHTDFQEERGKMSYTSNIKNEILNLEYSETELISELSAIVNISGEITKNEFSIYTENIGVKDLFGV